MTSLEEDAVFRLFIASSAVVHLSLARLWELARSLHPLRVDTCGDPQRVRGHLGETEDKHPNATDKNFLSKGQYLSLNVLLQRILLPDFNYEDALKAAAGDWEEDSEGRQSMSQGAFIRFLFTLCRLWCHTDSNKDCDREEERERERARGNTDRTETGDGKREAPGSVLLSDASLHLFAPAIRLLLKNYVFFLSGIWLSLSASSPDLCKLRFPPPVPARSRTREREHGGKSWTNSKTRAISSTSSHLALSPFPPLPQVFFESLWRGGTEFQEQLEAARKAAQRAICARESVDKQNRENEKRGEERNTEEVPRPRDHFRGGGGEKEKEKSGVTTTFPSPLTIHWMLLLIEGSADPRIRLSSSSSESPSGATATEKKKTTEKVQGHAEQSPQPLPPSLLRIEQDLFLMLSDGRAIGMLTGRPAQSRVFPLPPSSRNRLLSVDAAGAERANRLLDSISSSLPSPNGASASTSDFTNKQDQTEQQSKRGRPENGDHISAAGAAVQQGEKREASVSVEIEFYKDSNGQMDKESTPPARKKMNCMTTTKSEAEMEGNAKDEAKGNAKDEAKHLSQSPFLTENRKEKETKAGTTGQEQAKKEKCESPQKNISGDLALKSTTKEVPLLEADSHQMRRQIQTTEADSHQMRRQTQTTDSHQMRRQIQTTTPPSSEPPHFCIASSPSARVQSSPCTSPRRGDHHLPSRRIQYSSRNPSPELTSPFPSPSPGPASGPETRNSTGGFRRVPAPSVHLPVHSVGISLSRLERALSPSASLQRQLQNEGEKTEKTGRPACSETSGENQKGEPAEEKPDVQKDVDSRVVRATHEISTTQDIPEKLSSGTVSKSEQAQKIDGPPKTREEEEKEEKRIEEVDRICESLEEVGQNSLFKENAKGTEAPTTGERAEKQTQEEDGNDEADERETQKLLSGPAIREGKKGTQGDGEPRRRKTGVISERSEKEREEVSLGALWLPEAESTFSQHDVFNSMKEEGELHSQSNERISVQPDALLSLPPEDFFFEQMQIKPPRGLDKRAPRGVPKHLRRGAPARVELPPPKRRHRCMPCPHISTEGKGAHVSCEVSRNLPDRTGLNTVNVPASGCIGGPPLGTSLTCAGPGSAVSGVAFEVRRSASLDWRGKRGVFDMPLQRAVEKYTARGLLTEEKEQNLKGPLQDVCEPLFTVMKAQLRVLLRERQSKRARRKVRARRGLRCRFREASVERERPSRSEAPKVPQLSVAEDSLSHCLAYVVPSSFRQGNGFKRDGLKGSQRNEAITKGKAREKKRGRGEVKRESVNTEMIRQEVKNAIAMTQRRSRKKEFVQSHDGHPADNGGQGVPVRESTHEGAADVFDKTVTALTDENRNVEPNENLAETTGSQMSPPPRCNLKTLYGRARKGDAHPVTVLEPPSYSQQQQGSGNTAGRGGHRERGHLSPGGGAGAGGHGVPPSPRQALRAEFRLPSSVWQERVEGSRDRERVLHRRPSQPLVEAVDSMRRESRGGFTAVAESLLKAHERQAERVEEASRLLEGLSTNRLTTLLQQRGKGARLGTLLSISSPPKPSGNN